MGQEKRKYPRYECKIKVAFEYFEGQPDEINVKTTASTKGKGYILDISRGGLLLVTETRVAVEMLIRLTFADCKKKKRTVSGTIVRTGLLRNNPSEVAQKYAQHSSKGDSYIGLQFTEPIDIDESDLKD